MATQPPRRVLEPLAAPQHFMLPSARELRAQAVQRLQSGLFGIAAVVLVVGLANIINDRARQADAATKPVASAAPAFFRKRSTNVNNSVRPARRSRLAAAATGTTTKAVSGGELKLVISRSMFPDSCCTRSR